MSTLHLSYDVQADRLTAQIEGTSNAGAAQIKLDKVTVLIDTEHELVVSFEIIDFSHFVGYHLLGQLLGDNAIRRIAAFQSSAVAQRRAREETIEFSGQPPSGRRMVRELLKAA